MLDKGTLGFFILFTVLPFSIFEFSTRILNYLACFFDSLTPPVQILTKSDRFSLILDPFRQLFMIFPNRFKILEEAILVLCAFVFTNKL